MVIVLFTFNVCDGNDIYNSIIFLNMSILHVFADLLLFVLLAGVFKLELFLPEEYPMAAPKVHIYYYSF